MAAGPAHHAVQSMTRIPCRGSCHGVSASGAAESGAEVGQSTAPVSSPHDGARSNGRGEVPEILKGTLGWTNRPEGLGSNTPRATNCSNSGMVEPSSTGPAGIRNNDASSSNSAVVRCEVCSRTAARNSSRRCEPLGGRRQVGVLEQIGPPDHEQEILELLGAVRGDVEVAVLAGLDRRHLDHPSGAVLLGPSGERGEHRGVGDHRHGHAVEHGHVHVLAPPAPPGLPVRGHGTEHGVRAGHPLSDTAPGGQRRLFGQPALPGRSARRLQGELGARALHPRAVAAERGDGHHDEGRVGQPQRVEVHRRARHQDVGARDQVGGLALDRPLGGVEEFEQSARAPTAQGIAGRRFHLDHVGARVGQHLRAVRTGYVGREVYDPHPFEHLQQIPFRSAPGLASRAHFSDVASPLERDLLRDDVRAASGGATLPRRAATGEGKGAGPSRDLRRAGISCGLCTPRGGRVSDKADDRDEIENLLAR